MKEVSSERKKFSAPNVRAGGSDATLLQKALALGLLAFLINHMFGSVIDDTLLVGAVIAIVLLCGGALLIFRTQGEIKKLQDERLSKGSERCE